jgi:hypothetical protein
VSTVAFIRKCLEVGMDFETALKAAEAFEAVRLATPLRSPPAEQSEEVWVYVIGLDSPDDDLVKVGISKHPNYRRMTLEKERRLNLYVAHTEGPFSRSVAASIERRAHDALSPLRERGEWFLCGVQHATDVVYACVNEAAQ